MQLFSNLFPTPSSLTRLHIQTYSPYGISSKRSPKKKERSKTESALIGLDVDLPLLAGWSGALRGEEADVGAESLCIVTPCNPLFSYNSFCFVDE